MDENPLHVAKFKVGDDKQRQLLKIEIRSSQGTAPAGNLSSILTLILFVKYASLTIKNQP